MQFDDSQIAEQVLLRFTELGYACLPVHDSFIVRSDQQALLEQVMKEEFLKFAGTSIQLEAKEIARKKGLLDVSKINLGTSIWSTLENCGKHLANYSVMNHYFETWRTATKSENDRWAEDMYLDEQFQIWKDSR
jgi:hypothetical protein